MYALFDIGATKTRVAVSDGVTIGALKVMSTPPECAVGVAQMREAVLAMLPKGEKLTAAAGGIAGTLDQNKTMAARAPHLPGWNNMPLKKELENAWGVPVALENDSAIVGLGEAVYGAGKGKRIIAYMTVSTGVGGARIVDGNIDRNAMGFEPGHHIIDAHAKEGGGSLEEYISGTSFQRRFGKKAQDIIDKAVWQEAADMLAVGVHNTIVYWSPDVVVLGGAMMLGMTTARNKIPFDAVVLSLKARMKIFTRLPEVRLAALGDVGGLWGAVALLTQIQLKKTQ